MSISVGWVRALVGYGTNLAFMLRSITKPKHIYYNDHHSASPYRRGLKCSSVDKFALSGKEALVGGNDTRRRDLWYWLLSACAYRR